MRETAALRLVRTELVRIAAWLTVAYEAVTEDKRLPHPLEADVWRTPHWKEHQALLAATLTDEQWDGLASAYESLSEQRAHLDLAEGVPLADRNVDSVANMIEGSLRALNAAGLDLWGIPLSRKFAS